MKSRLASPLKWHGGKSYLASKIVDLMPAHTHYVEPYAGGLSVLLAKNPEGISEVVNDLNFDLSIFWRVIADEAYFQRVLRIIEATPFSEIAWRDANEDYVMLGHELSVPAEVTAAKFFIRCRQSLAGRMESFAPLSRSRTRRGMNEQASAWLSAIEGLPEVHERLKRVVILNRPAIKVIASEDSPTTLLYCDPPYLHETRTATDVYDHEMKLEDHRDLLASLTRCKGKVMLSGYRSTLYDEVLRGWQRHDFDLPNNSAGGETKRRMTECVWCNF